ncbi:MAG: hypothetical protein M1828_005727 [Chrysothrix sp. TS-e1954]|nr:MAG: hypothetical protein M1828_005727 [Chrysothrix sp. TS-e1954]
MAEKGGNRDIINRGSKNPNILGSTTFIGLRAIDPYLQYTILTGQASIPILSTLGLRFLSPGPVSTTGYALLDNLQLSPYRLTLLSMAVGASAKHILWKLFIGQEEMPVAPAAFMGASHTAVNSINTLLVVCSATSIAAGRGEGAGSRDWPAVPLAVGAALFATGLITEFVAEVQRAAFKRKPENEGKPYTAGLFSLARHINYGGYAMWRTGFALAGGGYVWGAVTAGLGAWGVATRKIPLLDEYCSTRYADMWGDYKAQTPYRLLPYIY